MRKVLLLILTVFVCMSMIGCKGNPKSKIDNHGLKSNIQGSDKAGDGLNNVTEKNYAKVLKDNFGIEPIIGDGWKIKEVGSPNKVNNLRIQYTTPIDIDAHAETKKYFDAMLAISTDGIYAVDLNWDTGALTKGDKYTDYEKFKNDYKSMWSYTYNGRNIQASVSIYPGDVLIILTFTN